jgi:hypothetical protein
MRRARSHIVKALPTEALAKAGRPLAAAWLPATACLLAAACLAPGALARIPRVLPGDPATPYSATLEQCITATVQLERSATFTAQMTAIPGTQRMGVRIELLQRARDETSFHAVFAPGLGVWRGAEPGVKIYKYVKQVTNLSAPAAYRAVVRFKWIGDRGRVLKRAELRTPRCIQPSLPPQVAQKTPAPSA